LGEEEDPGLRTRKFHVFAGFEKSMTLYNGKQKTRDEKRKEEICSKFLQREIWRLTVLHEVDFHDVSSIRVRDGAVVGSKIGLLGSANDERTSHPVWKRILQDGVVRVT